MVSGVLAYGREWRSCVEVRQQEPGSDRNCGLAARQTSSVTLRCRISSTVAYFLLFHFIFPFISILLFLRRSNYYAFILFH